MSSFTSEYQQFFKELEKENNKEWFEANRKRYEEHVKRPFYVFVEAMIDLIRTDDAEVQITAKDAVFRINKDTRFSKEKSSYKPHMATNISKEGRSSKEWPGFYFQFAADRLTVGGGTYLVEPSNLLNIRKAIVNDVLAFQRLIRAKRFTSKYSAIRGESNKVLPPEFREASMKEPLVANKQFYYMCDLDSDVLLMRDLPKRLLNYYYAGKDINSFLKRALST